MEGSNHLVCIRQSKQPRQRQIHWHRQFGSPHQFMTMIMQLSTRHQCRYAWPLLLVVMAIMVGQSTSFAPMQRLPSTIPNLVPFHRPKTIQFSNPYIVANTRVPFPPSTRLASTVLRDSLQSLVESIKNSRQKQTIFVGGKGGVGKVRRGCPVVGMFGIL